MCDTLETALLSVLKKTYQSNWKKIMHQSMTETFHNKLMKKVQGTLCIADGEDEVINQQIIDFSNKSAKVLL